MFAQTTLLSYPGLGFGESNVNTEMCYVTTVQLNLKFQVDWI